MSVVVDDIVELVLERPAHGGYSVGRVDGQVVFVRLGIPGERVRARITALGSGGRFAYGEVDHVLEPSPDRVVPRCLHAVPGGCGGCDWQQATIARQRSMKAEIVREQLIRVGGFDPADPLLVDLRVEPCGDDPEGFGYRTRMDFVGDERGRLGLRRARSHDVIPLTACPLAVSEINACEAFHQPWGNGATIRVARTAQGVVVNPEEAAPITVSETVGDTRFDVVADGFWQVHRNAPVTFADIVRTMLEPRAGEFLVDAYGGVGLFAGMLGPILGPGGRTLLVEGDRTAARLAKRNLRTLQHVEVVSERVDRWLQTTRVLSVDLVVLDPPRSGAGPKVMSGLLSMSPRRMVYVACDPASLARDLAAARKAGYRLTSLRAVDAFPQTAHVETFALLEPGA